MDEQWSLQGVLRFFFFFNLTKSNIIKAMRVAKPDILYKKRRNIMKFNLLLALFSPIPYVQLHQKKKKKGMFGSSKNGL